MSVRVFLCPPFKQLIRIPDFVQNDDMATESACMNDAAYVQNITKKWNKW